MNDLSSLSNDIVLFDWQILQYLQEDNHTKITTTALNFDAHRANTNDYQKNFTGAMYK